MNISELKKQYSWRAIPGCPGRSVLKHPNKQLTFKNLLGYEPEVKTFQVDQLQDLVLIVLLEDGALITYQKPDGTLIHTLNTPEGFTRKLNKLGISLMPNK
jgi:hypothetical protein